MISLLVRYNEQGASAVFRELRGGARPGSLFVFAVELFHTDSILNISVLVKYRIMLYTIRMKDNVKRRPGRVPGPQTVKTTILLPPDLAEWGKQQPEGLSSLVRRLLEAEQKRIASNG